MRIHEFEAWILDVAELVQAGRPNEDSRVELKREWIEPRRAARRIAGHANAARGAEILWIVGVDPKGDPSSRVAGAHDEDLASWWDQVASHLDGPPPRLESRVLRVDGKGIVGLLMDTTTAPYVVKNPDSGPDLEVPWREGTRVRSARREDLIRLLSPLRSRPSFETLSAEVVYARRSERTSFRFRAVLYMDRLLDNEAVIPFHRSHATVRLPWMEVALEDLDITPEYHGRRRSEVGTLVRGTLASVPEPLGQVTIAQPLRLTTSARVAAAPDEGKLRRADTVSCRLEFHVVELETPVVIDIAMAGPEERAPASGVTAENFELVWTPRGLPPVSPHG